MADPWLEWDSMATRGSPSTMDLNPFAAFSATYASLSAFGWTSRPQSLKMNTPFSPNSQSGTTMTKKLLTSLHPGAVFRIWREGRKTSPVEWHAPDTMPSASPIFTIMTPKYSSSSISSIAFSGVMPLAWRSSYSFSANASRRSDVRGSTMRAPSSS